MVEKTCAACDCDLDANSIKVKIGGKSVEVCCVDCARKLKEAHASAAAPSEGRDMDGDKMAASAHDEQARIARPSAALLRSEEHTSELQSLRHLRCRLRLV